MNQTEKFLKKLNRGEILNLVLGKIYFRAKELEMYDIMHKIITQDVVIDNYFKRKQKGVLISLLHDDDELIDVLYNIRSES